MFTGYPTLSSFRRLRFYREIRRAFFCKCRRRHHNHYYHHHHHHHISVMELGNLLTRFGLTYPEVSSNVCHDSFCQVENSVSLLPVIYYEACCKC